MPSCALSSLRGLNLPFPPTAAFTFLCARACVALLLWPWTISYRTAGAKLLCLCCVEIAGVPHSVFRPSLTCGAHPKTVRQLYLPFYIERDALGVLRRDMLDPPFFQIPCVSRISAYLFVAERCLPGVCSSFPCSPFVRKAACRAGMSVRHEWIGGDPQPLDSPGFSFFLEQVASLLRSLKSQFPCSFVPFICPPPPVTGTGDTGEFLTASGWLSRFWRAGSLCFFEA